MRAPRSIDCRGVLLIAVIGFVAVLLRAPTLSQQSLWLDEAFTSVGVDGSLAGVLTHVRDVEATPPLYFYVSWAWTQLFGGSDAALRSLSVVAGMLTVPAAYVLGRDWLDRGVGVAAAALAATSPLLVWYSQEARAYALALLFTTVSLVLVRRAAYESVRASWGWAAAAVLAAWTHYFTAFITGPAAVLLLVRRGRAAAPALAAAAAACLPLAALVREQTGDHRTAWIDQIELTDRLVRGARAFVSAPPGAPGRFLGLLAGSLLLAGLVLAVRRRSPPHRQPLLAIAAAALAIPLALVVAGIDYINYRNLIFVWPPVAALAAGGLLAMERWRLAGWSAVGALIACFVAINIGIALNSDHQREDWQKLSRGLGGAGSLRLIVTAPRYSDAPLRHYGHSLTPLEPEGAPPVREVAVSGRFATPAGELANRLGGGFSVAFEETYAGGLRLVKIRARKPERPDREALRGAPRGSLWLEQPR